MNSTSRVMCVLLVLYTIYNSVASFSDSGVPCYLHPSGDQCHYRMKLDSPTCTSPEKRKFITNRLRELSRNFTALETRLLSLGIIRPDSTCSKLPSIENGGVVYSDLNLAPGCEGHYVCNEGFTILPLNGRKEFICTEDGVWDGDVLEVPVRCVSAVNQCEVPADVVNGNITFQDNDPANIIPGDMIEYACNEGTELQGPKYRFCQRSGNWSEEEPQCVVLNSEQEHDHQPYTAIDNLGVILGGGFGGVAGVIVLIVVTVIIIVPIFLKKGKTKHRREKGSSALVVYDHDSSVNTESNETRELFDSEYVPLVSKEISDSDVVKPNIKFIGRKVSSKNTPSRKRVGETMM